jgi:hypothetical protein
MEVDDAASCTSAGEEESGEPASDVVVVVWRVVGRLFVGSVDGDFEGDLEGDDGLVVVLVLALGVVLDSE